MLSNCETSQPFTIGRERSQKDDALQYDNLNSWIFVMDLEISYSKPIALFLHCRLDIDQAARRNAQKYFNFKDPDFYNFEGNNCFFSTFCFTCSINVLY